MVLTIPSGLVVLAAVVVERVLQEETVRPDRMEVTAATGYHLQSQAQRSRMQEAAEVVISELLKVGQEAMVVVALATPQIRARVQTGPQIQAAEAAEARLTEAQLTEAMAARVLSSYAILLHTRLRNLRQDLRQLRF